jgi:hypothetical protein
MPALQHRPLVDGWTPCLLIEPSEQIEDGEVVVDRPAGGEPS